MTTTRIEGQNGWTHKAHRMLSNGWGTVAHGVSLPLSSPQVSDVQHSSRAAGSSKPGPPAAVGKAQHQSTYDDVRSRAVSQRS